MSSTLPGGSATLEPLPGRTLELTNGAVVVPGARVEDSALPLLTSERKPLAVKMVSIMQEARHGGASQAELPFAATRIMKREASG